jgi:hypothetical protein
MGGLRSTPCEESCHRFSIPLQKSIDAGVISWNGQKPMLPPPEGR